MTMNTTVVETPEITKDELKAEILNDYRIACESREASLFGRKEVLTGKAKFGIFGDGKEVAQVALAKQFRKGDWRSGYYRDQTIMFAAGVVTVEEFFAQLYAHADVNADPHSAGRQMNAHFATRLLNDDGTWRDQTAIKNSSSDMSPTGSQMPRLLGLAYASKFYRENTSLKECGKLFSIEGNEVAFGTIGDASTSEGMFWETINAAGVLQVPMVISVWDDGHGISVPKKYQTTKESISEILKGFQRDENANGFEIFRVNGWNYPELCLVYEEAVSLAREKHIPVLVHIEELTQPQGHSTSGSHERYKSKERLQWEQEYDCLHKMREWLVKKELAVDAELNDVEESAKKTVRDARKRAWDAYIAPIKKEIKDVSALLNIIVANSSHSVQLAELRQRLTSTAEPYRRDIYEAVKKTLRLVCEEQVKGKQELQQWLHNANVESKDRYDSHLYSETAQAASKISPVSVIYGDENKMVDGREILRDNFDAILSNYLQVVIFGQDSGKLGGVNQGLEGLQAKYGEIRVFDTGIRECTIIGQAIGLALRGMRPIAEIQYLDYLMYALQILSDDLATIRYRTKGGQKAPVIIRTRGHRLEGIWHSGSQLGTIINALRGICICVPRNMTQAAGFYNTLLASDDSGLIIEPLNGYRLKEKLPSNFGEFRVPIGVPEIIREGTDVTIITYGSMVRIVEEGARQLEDAGISAEVIDVQTLLPFDINHTLVESLKKTNKVIFADEDVPGGASAYMMQKVLEEQGGYAFLDSAPATLSAKEHRPAYGSDGDYFSKPGAEDVFDAAYTLMSEAEPKRFPGIYS